MYTSFFGFKCKPFQLTPDPEFLFMSRCHKRALTYLNYGITENSGFILVTGEIGTGKTTIIRSMIKRLPQNVKLARVNNTLVTSEQLISMINEDFGLNVNGKNKITLLRELNDFLIDQYANEYRSILIIDEAQNLTSELLEELRMLSNLETDISKLLQIILVGQPELRKTLAQPEIRQLRQRISVSCNIQPLTREETEEYIFHRLEIAGNRRAVSFHEGIIDIIHNFSRGIPRLINIACDFLMLSAFVEETTELSLDLVKEVIGEIEIENRYWQDEARENFSSNNGGILKETIKRINKLEEEFSKSNISQTEKTDIFDRLSGSEKLINSAITKSKAELINMDIKLNNIMRELSQLKKVAAELEKRSQAESKTKENSLWGKIF